MIGTDISPASIQRSPATASPDRPDLARPADPSCGLETTKDSDDHQPTMRETGSEPIVQAAVVPSKPADDRTIVHHEDCKEDADDLVLQLLTLSGKRRRIVCRKEERVADVTRRVWEDWPEDWTSEPAQPEKPDQLSLLYRGRILPGKETLSSAGVKSPEGEGPEPIVLHLHVRTLPPLPPDEPSNEETSASCCGSCLIA